MSRPYSYALTPSSADTPAEGWARARALLAQLTAPGVPPGPPQRLTQGGGGADGAQGTRGPSQGGLTPVPAAQPPLDSNRSQLLSPGIETRRRELLVNHRNRWLERAESLSDLVAWYQAELDRVERLAAAAELAGAYRTEREVEVGVGELVADLVDARGKLRYARARVRSLTEDLGPRSAVCGQNRRWIRCGCEDGSVRPVPDECRQRAVCGVCRKRWALRMRRRLLDAGARWLERQGRAARTRMITLTIQHSGDLARDRAELVRGWTALRKRFHRWWGYAVPFCMVWETTPGLDGLGHEHAHVIVLGGPAWWPYAGIQRIWRHACPRSSHLDIRVASRRKDQAKAAASYLCKYATKGADLDGELWSDELVAQVIAAHYNQRWISTSHRFWSPPEPICKHCGEHCRRAKPPDGWTAGIDRAEGMPAGRTAARAAPS